MGYHIPIEFYRERYIYLKLNPTIFEVFKFLIETRSNFSKQQREYVILNIDLLRSYDLEFAKYKFI
ncbi:hypothetical protein [Chryseobacterium taichungense]|uniref:hypothetical protein n=1 Tax=Chryseobacterium taichungense TaxID=295069 RepID=UPI0015A5CB2A|nr:hypothetical protein [Chryseobacterium taichungense]